MNILYITPILVLLASVIGMLQMQSYYLSNAVRCAYQAEKNFYKHEQALVYAIAYYKKYRPNLDNSINIKFENQKMSFTEKDNIIYIASDNCSCQLKKTTDLNLLVSHYQVLHYTK